MNQLIVKDTQISIKDGYYSLTDIAKNLSSRPPNDVIRDWLSSLSTIQYLQAWELHNNSKHARMHVFRIEDLRNDKKSITAKRYTERGGIGVKSSSGRYGGTYAHIEIAFEFATWLNPEFKVLFFQQWVQMKENEFKNNGIEWTLTKMISNSMENVILAESTLKQVRGEDEETTI